MQDFAVLVNISIKVVKETHINNMVTWQRHTTCSLPKPTKLTWLVVFCFYWYSAIIAICLMYFELKDVIARCGIFGFWANAPIDKIKTGILATFIVCLCVIWFVWGNLVETVINHIQMFFLWNSVLWSECFLSFEQAAFFTSPRFDLIQN